MKPRGRDTSFGEMRVALERLTRVSLALRFFAVPGMAIAVTIFSIIDGTAWRIAVLLPLCTLAIGWSVLDRRAYVKRGAALAGWQAATFGVNTLQIAVVGVTGGLDSPLAPALIAGSGVAGVLIPKSSKFVLALQLCGLAGYAVLRNQGLPLVPQIFGGRVEAVLDGRRTIVLLVLFALMVTMINRLGSHLRAVLDAGLMRARRAEEEMLHANAEHTHGLVALSAEIAHELKNPLASVKGLAALVSKDVAGKTKERVDVLRGEVDRMQRILEEFLTFSRPLVPLALERIDLGDLARDVVALHEGMLVEGAVRIEIDTPPSPVEIVADPNKVRQALVNVLQNAIAASPSRGAVHVAVTNAPSDGVEGARLAVCDEGPGLDPAVKDRVFEPGVTTKTKGNGLGLTIARSLARQHGGDIELAQRPERGLEVALWFPHHPPKDHPAGAQVASS
jgi:two-component system sensor histidine kinase HydH